MYLTPCFRLITTSTGHHKQNLNLNHIIDKNIIQVHMEPLTESELISIVKELFPSLATIADRMVNVYLKFSSGNHQNDDGACSIKKSIQSQVLIGCM